ncbi:bacillithiol biosynthesis cysteine-adding enzyme BshC [Shouchella shacheensis]|uniref:bacillithiol biosynthesis cysteine-adding enzyme BshC n=1 Tax=Shouchella shacheensis TaxID=1649580 RepID=UPI0007400FF1|nr:bacillithiol biosynthesis cysteine-adding enzyme BshC [Shouchella shacheensis]
MNIQALDQSFLSGFLRNYVQNQEDFSELFSYRVDENEWLEERSQDLKTYAWEHRRELVNYLRDQHERLRPSEACTANLHKLEQLDALVVVGGQQAGLLTGPLYTVYKAMTLILLSKQYEQKLGQPVVPLFWVAGEDHDLEEIRFVHTESEHGWKKQLLKDESFGESASEKELPKEVLHTFMEDVFATLPETEHTQALKAHVEEAEEQADTYTDFFIVLMHELFYNEGLLFLNSDDPRVRTIERPFFEKLITQVETLQQKQQEGAERFRGQSGEEPIVTETENAHLFFSLDGSRRRLDYGDGRFYVRDTNHSFSKEELLAELSAHPERFSNNVVTRPLMQEWVLPTLAFVGGPGEIKYWATLRPAFEAFHLKMAPVIPRLAFTIVPRHVKKWVEEKGYNPELFMQGEGERKREEWLEAQHSFKIDEVVREQVAQVETAHQPIRKLASSISPTLGAMSEKNLELILEQMEFLEKRMHKEVRDSHEHELAKFTEATHWLYPKEGPQERTLHPYVFLNMVGCDFVSRLLEKKIVIDGRHQLICL